MNYTLKRITADLNQKKVVLFGAGNYGNRVKDVLLGGNYVNKIFCYIDNYKRGKTEDGIPIYSPQILKTEKECFVIVCNKRDTQSIFTQLDNMGLRGGDDYISYIPFIMAKQEDQLLNGQRPNRKNSPYGTIYMEVGYAAWQEDEEFLAFEPIVDKYSLCGMGKLNFLWRMVGEAAKLNEGVFVEVGTWRGGSGCIIAKKLSLLGKPNTVFLCDTFSGVVKAGVKDNTYVGGEHSDTSVDIVKNLAKTCGLNNINILQGIFPDDTGAVISKNQIAFAHIDVDVYQSAKDVVAFIWPRLLHGGIIVFDDYGTPGTQGMKKFLDEVKDLTDRIFVSNIMGQGVLIKI